MLEPRRGKSTVAHHQCLVSLSKPLTTIREPAVSEIDSYGVTFDHLVPADDFFPEVLQINLFEIDEDEDEGGFANKHLLFTVDLAEYIGKKILAVPRCCQKRNGTTDRTRVNGLTGEWVLGEQGVDRTAMRNLLVAWGVYSITKPEKRADSVPQAQTDTAPKDTAPKE